ncbi:uncharacterized protein [Nicotiana sylvestris]|uniref:uncharacterized protein n=1 Tax=Nicotiana sylvestris TaxID=4096 RepID=UPI00388C6545
MAGKGEARVKAVAIVTTNILNTINEDGKGDNENATPNGTPQAKPAQKENGNTTQADIVTTTGKQPLPQTGNTYPTVDAGNDTLAGVLKKMEEMERTWCPKLLPKRDVGRFIEQPYNEEADPYSIPKTFKTPPYLKIYDGTTDPEDYIIHYATVVKGNDLSKKQVSWVLLKKFGETLTGGALTWYSQLAARSIATFEEMADKFVTSHARAKKAEARVNDIFAVRQSPGEGLRDFLASVRTGKARHEGEMATKDEVWPKYSKVKCPL